MRLASEENIIRLKPRERRMSAPGLFLPVDPSKVGLSAVSLLRTIFADLLSDPEDTSSLTVLSDTRTFEVTSLEDMAKTVRFRVATP